MFAFVWLSAIALLSSTTFVHGLKYTPSEIEYNLNANKSATNPADYWITERTNHTYHPSPENWRFPFYTVVLDRFVNGDPTNDNANKTLFETDMMSTQIRNGGDLQGLVDSLDYIAGMGIKVRHNTHHIFCSSFAFIRCFYETHILTKNARVSTWPARLS